MFHFCRFCRHKTKFSSFLHFTMLKWTSVFFLNSSPGAPGPGTWVPPGATGYPSCSRLPASVLIPSRKDGQTTRAAESRSVLCFGKLATTSATRFRPPHPNCAKSQFDNDSLLFNIENFPKKKKKKME